MIWIPQIVSSIALLWALNPDNPYFYYTLLRCLCCPCFAFLALRAYRLDKEKWAWILGVTAFIYNPLQSIHLPRELWCIVNVITVVIALVSVFALRNRFNYQIDS